MTEYVTVWLDSLNEYIYQCEWNDDIKPCPFNVPHGRMTRAQFRRYS
jgi:hypothetical protein